MLYFYLNVLLVFTLDTRIMLAIELANTTNNQFDRFRFSKRKSISASRRALDNQLYVATASPARDETSSYVAWGHSTVVNPW